METFDATGRVRVLLVIDELDIGGTDQQIVELVRRLPRDRFVPLVCCFRHGRKAEEIERLGVRVAHLPKRWRVDPGFVRRLARLMRRERIDIVHTFLIGANLWGRLAALLAGVPTIVASERNVDVWEEPVKRHLGRALAVPTHRLVANAEAVRSYLIGRGLDASRVVTIRNGVDVERFQAPLDVAALRKALGFGPDDVVAIVVARLEPQKGHDTVVEAAARLRERFPQLHFLFVGGGSRQTSLPALVAHKGLSDRILFTGFRTDSADLMRAADLSILVSTKEGLSNTLLESLAAGLPVIASRVGGNAEVVSPDVGFLVPPEDPAALSDAIGRLVADRPLAARMSASGRARAEHEFSVGRMVADTVALYDSVDRPSPISTATPCDIAS
jgi:glycosyltransferase involved in cell wall biosynthesis